LVSYKLYNNYFSNSIKTFDKELDNTKTKEQFKDFLYKNQGKFVHLSITLLDDMKNEVIKGMDAENRINFNVPDKKDSTKIIRYMIKLPDDGHRDFSFDIESGKLDGIFKTFKREDLDGNPIINLVPINPKWLK
jgi:hypothetical protein